MGDTRPDFGFLYRPLTCAQNEGQALFPVWGGEGQRKMLGVRNTRDGELEMVPPCPPASAGPSAPASTSTLGGGRDGLRGCVGTSLLRSSLSPHTLPHSR